MTEDEAPEPEEASGTPPPPTDETVSKDNAANATGSQGSQSSQQIWLQNVEDNKDSTGDSIITKGSSTEDAGEKKEYKQYETKSEDQKDKDIEKGDKKQGAAKRASFASSASGSSESSGASELAALKREMTVRKSRMDIETLSLMAKLEKKKAKQRKRLIGLAVFVVVVGGIFGAIFALT